MKNKLFIFFILSTLLLPLYGQTTNLKEDAIKVAGQGNYTKAIELLEKAKTESPNDPEIYYYLGVFMHYLAYDSVPLVGYNSSYPDKVLGNLEKAIKLKPDYGDAYYFIGAQYGGNALDAIQDQNAKEYKNSFKKAYDMGAFPAWLIEYDKNILKSCDANAILFIGGDSEFDPIQYLQVIENYRKDVTVIPISLLESPWYVITLKKGFDDILKGVSISLSEEQIMDLHPYKWDTLIVSIPLSRKSKDEFNLSGDEVMKWKLEPDIIFNGKPCLSSERAVLLNIIESNKWERPIYFSLGINSSSLSGLDKYFQLSGMAFKLLPFETDKTNYKTDAAKIEEVLLNKENIKNFKDVDKHNMPRVSYTLNNYKNVLIQLALFYRGKKQFEKINEIANYMKENLTAESLPAGEKYIQVINELSNN
ncbi:MAG: tetratricopeptide repeat protein [Ignavibacteriaceae bacterium]